ncbi:MAG TPA: HAMP domain-containing sensor histidine kinase [Clostridia bacterium]|nr:HAMP domain-containing sensor histidine kinase [Clostridia bacterium]
MIRSLKKKLILINMSLVLIVLLAVFTGLCLYTAGNQQQNALRGLTALLQRRGEDVPKLDVGKSNDWKTGLPQRNNDLLAGFVVSVDSNSTAKIETAHSVNISADTAQTLAQLAQDSKQTTGLLRAYSLRYYISQDSGQTRIAFLDASSDIAAMAELVVSSLLVGILALLAFFFVSLLLANFALKPVELAWKRQKQFVADASHELKTPLTVILANQKILLAHPEKTIAQQSRWIENTQSEGDRMKSLVEDLLFLAKTGGSANKETLSSVNLSDIMQGSILSFASLAFESGITLSDSIQPGIALTGSEPKLRRLCGILLDNALKYVNPNGIVEIDLRAENGSVLMRVHNTGTPIPAEELPHLFERFYRIDRARSAGGYGLGLSIAQSIVHAHGGKITVSSTAEEGTTFTVTLPLRDESNRKNRKDAE